MKEPKTIDDYKELLKAFKLKILKQKMKIEELEELNTGLQTEIRTFKTNNQNYNRDTQLGSASRKILHEYNQPNEPMQLHDVDTSTMEGKVQIMNGFKQGAAHFGITLESIFRIADFQYQNEIESDYFRSVLSKLKLGLSPKHISCLIYIFDESCTGFISKKDYFECLHAYKVSMEENSLHYTQDCLLKLAQLFNDEKINTGKFYDQMLNKSIRTVNIDVFEKKIKNTFKNKILEREIVGAFNEIDLESDQVIDRQNFLYNITSFINRSMSLSQQKNPKSQDKFITNFPSLIPTAKQPAKIHTQNAQSRIVHTEAQQQQQFPQKNDVLQLLYTKIPPESLNEHELVQELKQKYKVTVPQIIEQICRFKLNKRLTVFMFKKALLLIRVMNQDLPIKLINYLYRVLDVNNKGSIYFAELFHFCLQNSTDLSIIFRLFGKYFLNEDLSAQKFWYQYGINSDHDVSKDRFLEIMNKSFYIKDDLAYNWERLWAYFDKGKGSIPAARIIDEMAKYQVR